MLCITGTMVLFVVDSGPCTVDSTATCFSSPNYQSTYGNLQQCFITAHEAVTLSVVAFSTESWYDELIVNGVQYSGTTGPDGVQVAAGSTITWRSHSTGAGFEICGETLTASPTTSPTTITPTIVGQTWTPTSTSPTSAPTSTPIMLFAVDSGPCTVDSTAACFRSPNYPSNYGNSGQCFITAHEAVTLSVTAFSTEAGYDKFTVNGVQYSGTTGPEGVQVAAGSTIIWRSGYRPGAGFEICGETFTITPTITGQTWTPTTSPNTLEDHIGYQACIASPSTCTYLCVPPLPVAVPSPVA